MDECEIFGSEFCRNGQCLNTVPGYKCFCRTGYFYDSSKLECVGKMAKEQWAPHCAWGDSHAAALRLAPAGPGLGNRLPGTFLGKKRGGPEAHEAPVWAEKGSHCSYLGA